MIHPRLGALLALLACNSTVAWAQVTELVSIDSNDVQENFNATLPPPAHFISTDGRFVVFVSDATNLVPGDTNNTWDIFVRDRLLRTTERMSVDSSGTQGNGISGLYGIAISGDGRFVAFESASNNLVPGDTNGAREVFVHDRVGGTTERVAVDSAGAQGNAASFYPSLSADGRYVAFLSASSNLVPGDTNGKWDVFVRDRTSGTTERVSIASDGSEGNNDCYYKTCISSDGRWVGFESAASNLVLGDSNALADVFIHDRVTRLTTMVSVATNGALGNGFSDAPEISDDARYVAFSSSSTNLVASDTNSFDDVFVHDCLTDTTERVSIAADGTQTNYGSGPPSISADGRWVSFFTAASTLVPGDTNNASDCFVRDMRNGTIERVSLTTGGLQVMDGGGQGCISSSGRYVVFLSSAAQLVPNDTNGYIDIFVRDRFATGFASLCDPGSNNVIACPCGNPPSGAGRGCDNSSFTGGATLSASGNAYLSIDSLVFTSSDETPHATTILLQGDALVSAGAVFGQGVRCAGGTLKRMYVKIAVNGSITAPDLAAGDATVSARSSSLGSPIQPGLPCLYLAYYRDPFVLGTCPASTSFNCTQTGCVSWWP